MIRELIQDLKSSSAIDIDYPMLHEAGCTCDDTELPHHVSSYSEIMALVDVAQDFLSYLPKPAYVSVARYMFFY